MRHENREKFLLLLLWAVLGEPPSHPHPPISPLSLSPPDRAGPFSWPHENDKGPRGYTPRAFVSYAVALQMDR